MNSCLIGAGRSRRRSLDGENGPMRPSTLAGGDHVELIGCSSTGCCSTVNGRDRSGAYMRQFQRPEMNVRKNPMLSALAVLLLSAVHTLVYARPNLPCWVQQVQERDGQIYIWFLPGYRERAYVSTKAQERRNQISPTATPEYLVVREGEAVVNGDGLHSGCEMTVERRDAQLGLQISAYVNLPGLPYDARTQLVPATTRDGSESPRLS